MNTKTRILALVTVIIVGYGVINGIVTGCQSSDQKVQDAKEKVKDANQDLKQTQTDAMVADQKAANAAAWKTLKAEWEGRVRSNENIIADLKGEMRKPGRAFDSMYETSIQNLEQKNKEMKMRIDAYEKSQSDWESFKREFSHDMDGLGKALNDLAVNNKK
jgi:hypothetical protein